MVRKTEAGLFGETEVEVKSAPLEAGGSGPVASCVLPTPVDREFDYLIPEMLVGHVERGMRVVVPFGKKRTLTGFVTDIKERSPLPASKLKALLEVPDTERLADEGIMRLTRWMADYYACSWGEALQAVIPAVMRRGKTYKTVGVLRLGCSKEDALEQANKLDAKAGSSEQSPYRKQAKVLRTIAHFEDEDFRPATLAEQLGFSQSPIQTLRKSGWLKIEKVPLADEMTQTFVAPEPPPKHLTREQEEAIKRITPVLDRDEYKTVLLKGITGSGKTEVYIRALEHALNHGKSGIVLVPEIALTPQTVRRFTGRLSEISGVAILHSAMTDKTRRHEWKRIRDGEARIVIGPRSAVFAPVKDLGVIIVDEEHESTYKQDNTPRYHARDVAVMRCHNEQAVCLLGSATPALESMMNAVVTRPGEKEPRYKLIELKNRVAQRKLPRVHVVDMAEECRKQRRYAFISQTLRDAAKDAVTRGEQAVMFLNRRGYHSFYQCGNCREVLLCPNCEVPMSLHRGMGQVVCHYCYETTPPKRICPSCNNGILEARGFGTEMLEDELNDVLGDVRIARMDSDTMKKREDYEDVLGRFREHEIDVLVGTQMIAKGLDFPNVTVVGVLHADLNLYMADFRAQERSFQLLTQVAGRAGRGDTPGNVFVQTFNPDHPCIQAARDQDFDAFYNYEMEQRRVAKYPPFLRLLAVTVEARNEERGKELARQLKAELDDVAQLERGRVVGVLGPATAPISRIRGRHRIQLLVKVRDHKSMEVVAERMRKNVKNSESLRVTLDVDPYSLL